MGLLEALKQYASDAAGGSLNPEVGNTLSGLLNYGKDRAKYIGGLLDDSSPINKDFKNWHDRTQLGLADLIAGKEGPQADYGYSQIMNMAGVAPLGITAWHGSPHKFDKFSLDKIGTGEGAQAYGHGLYLAESPEVAKQYATALSNGKARGSLLYEVTGTPKDDYGVQLKKFYDDHSPASGTSYLENIPVGGDFKSRREAIEEFKRLTGKNDGDFKLKKEGVGDYSKIIITPKEQLYKTDIPDEAVARFLDWDKPLSQQAPEVQKAMNDIIQAEELFKGKYSNKVQRSGGDFIETLNELMAGPNQSTNYLRDAGIPGIRYLDGGSRSAGKGSSNFVLFDPEMIRILERNGQPTGLEPWKPGEYRLGDLLK